MERPASLVVIVMPIPSSSSLNGSWSGRSSKVPIHLEGARWLVNGIHRCNLNYRVKPCGPFDFCGCCSLTVTYELTSVAINPRLVSYNWNFTTIFGWIIQQSVDLVTLWISRWSHSGLFISPWERTDFLDTPLLLCLTVSHNYRKSTSIKGVICTFPVELFFCSFFVCVVIPQLVTGK